MMRLLTAMKTDVTVQVRNNLYTIGIIAGVLVALALGWLAGPDQLFTYVPTTMLLVVGGSTLLYVAGMILFEKDEGTLNANIVSPMRTSEYLWSKIITLTILATVEGFVMIGGAMLIIRFSAPLTPPSIPILLLGIFGIGIVYTLIGIVLIVRFDKITDFLIPMSGVAVLLQLPFVYFLGWVEEPILLLIPTSAPTMIMQGAYTQLAAWEWMYGIGYTLLLIIGFTFWAYRAFHKHIILKVG
ncbi:MAG: ABC transporter permease [Chloroflexi bacterium]|nr:MAG: ABC transporter permease [Chloroflexota bacterium]MBL1194115.1 ABC transporter permease [Chloroflexota bacterium]NOH11408.1 ABC transporter permease [Chloroflexota bacterium]